MKYLKLLGIKSLSGKTPKVIRCESCISSKIHRMGHKNLHKTERPTYAPGDCIHTDIMGPSVRSSGGAYYAQLFKDIGSNYKWCHWMARKTGADQAVEQVLIDCKARSGKDVKIIKTDGDGVFTSKSFEALRQKYKFIHEFSAPEDPVIEREIRTLFEGTATALAESGAPATFWMEAQQHFVFTKNVLPIIAVKEGDKTVRKSPRKILNPTAGEFNLEYLVAFGTECTCYVPISRREGGKTPAQRKAFKGVMCGYIDNMDAYKIYDLETQKFRKVSYAFTVVSEGFFPFRDKRKWPRSVEEEPSCFYPSPEALADGEEWNKMEWDEDIVDDFNKSYVRTPTFKENEEPTPFEVQHAPETVEEEPEVYEIELSRPKQVAQTETSRKAELDEKHTQPTRPKPPESKQGSTLKPQQGTTHWGGETKEKSQNREEKTREMPDSGGVSETKMIPYRHTGESNTSHKAGGGKTMLKHFWEHLIGKIKTGQSIPGGVLTGIKLPEISPERHFVVQEIPESKDNRRSQARPLRPNPPKPERYKAIDYRKKGQAKAYGTVWEEEGGGGRTRKIPKCRNFRDKNRAACRQADFYSTTS